MVLVVSIIPVVLDFVQIFTIYAFMYLCSTLKGAMLCYFIRVNFLNLIYFIKLSGQL